MTRVIAINANNDIFLDASNNIAMATGQDAVVQACQTIAQTQLGECVLMTGLGLPNRQAVWVGSPNYNLWKAFLTDLLLSVDGVLSVVSVDLTQNGKTLQYTATIESEFGASAISGVLTNG